MMRRVSAAVLLILVRGAESFIQLSHAIRHKVVVSGAEPESSKGYKFGDLSKGLWKKVSKSSDPYKFGDLSKLVGKKVSKDIGQVTGKPDYKLGDLSFWLDAQAKQAVAGITGKDEYEFGDLSRWADARAKDKMGEFTGQSEYQFGDVTKEIASRVASRQYTFDDLVVLLKVLLTFGVGLQPVAAFFPVKLLIDLLNYSIMGDLGNRLAAALAMEIDKRVKLAVTGDSGYQLGDLSKKALLRFTGKPEYSFGDVTRAVVERMEDTDTSSEPLLLFGTTLDAPPLTSSLQGKEVATATAPISLSELDQSLLAELDAWDVEFSTTPGTDIEAASGVNIGS
mmetsp:Transcript_16763/g.34156  ORF Transcript_16763/g.34156 Transcript_16763/m.34156 type:complete len:338 (-) Transcript_16763:205-1218(-)